MCFCFNHNRRNSYGPNPDVNTWVFWLVAVCLLVGAIVWGVDLWQHPYKYLAYCSEPAGTVSVVTSTSSRNVSTHTTVPTVTRVESIESRVERLEREISLLKKQLQTPER